MIAPGAGLFDAERWVGEQADATGLLIEGRFHLSGGFAWLSRDLPLEQFPPYAQATAALSLLRAEFAQGAIDRLGRPGQQETAPHARFLTAAAKPPAARMS